MIGSVWRVIWLVAPLRGFEKWSALVSLFAIMGLLVLPLWIMFCAHQLGYIRGATNDLTPPEQAIVEDYKLKVRVKRKLIEEKVNRWT